MPWLKKGRRPYLLYFASPGRVDTMQSKLQSAMEYLMTYGWSILIIAVVLGALFGLGVFNGAAALGSGCVAQPGFLCQMPVLSSNGLLSASIGQAAQQQITVIATGCSNTASEPSFVGLRPSVELTNGQILTSISFQCPLVSNTIGSSFTGTLWIEYTTPQYPGVTIPAELGTIGVKVAASGAPAMVSTSSSSSTTLLSTSVSSSTESSSSSSTTSIVPTDFVFCVSSASSPYNLTYFAPVSSSGVGGWNLSAQYPVPLSENRGAACDISGGYIYCLGGSSGQNASFYAPISSAGIGNWIATTSYPQQITLGFCGINGGDMYCVGGLANPQATYYAPVSGSGIGPWTQTTSYPGEMALSSCVFASGDIFCIGSGISNTNQTYFAPVSGTGIGGWNLTTNYPVIFGQGSCFVSGGYIYCIGNGNNNPTQDYYAPISGSGIGGWNLTASETGTAYDLSCKIHNGYVYCVGGGTLDAVSYAQVLSPGLSSLSGTTPNPNGFYGDSQSCQTATT